MRITMASMMTVFVLMSAISVRGADDGKHLFILSGQSNMRGLNPDLSFTPAVQEKFGKDNVIVVKDAQGGQPIRRWHKGWKPAKGEEPKSEADLYERLMGKVNAAVAGKDIKTVTFIWMQGESDAKQSHGEVYAASLKGVIDQIKADLKRDDVNFVIGRISDFDMANKNFPHWTMVRDAQVKLAEGDKCGAWVDTDDLNDKGTPEQVKHDLHYTKDGYIVLGQRFAEKAIELINKVK